MSYTELHVGTLVPITINSEEFAEYYINNITKIGLGNCDTYLERLLDEYYDKFVMLNNRLYNIFDNNITDNYSYHESNKDGSISYVIQFYNGGASFIEALKNEIEDGSDR